MKTFMTLLALAAIAAGAAPGAAQARQTGTLRIVVRDPSGAVIPNAAVLVTRGDDLTLLPPAYGRWPGAEDRRGDEDWFLGRHGFSAAVVRS